ncbi:MAG: polyprenyl synthetase family protein [Thermoguttaceae bacterium]
MTEQTTSASFFRPEIAHLIGERVAAVDEMLVGRVAALGSGCPDALREAMRTSLTSPGKRFRPLLVLLACEVCGGAWRAALPAACAVEMIHAYTLIHDDLPALDNDDLRRGQPTCHIRFGEAMAILAGDALQALAFETLAATQPPSLVAAAVAVLGKAVGGEWLVGGQADDISVLSETVERSPDELKSLMETIHDRKTGALIGASLELGGIVAGATAEQYASLHTYGRAVGLAFQITDDVLDWVGDEKVVGKRLRKDGKHNKLTYPALLGVDEAVREAEANVKRACDALQVFAASPARETLEVYAQFLQNRRS